MVKNDQINQKYNHIFYTDRTFLCVAYFKLVSFLYEIHEVDNTRFKRGDSFKNTNV